MKSFFKDSLINTTLRGKERNSIFKQKLNEILPKSLSQSLDKSKKKSKKSVKFKSKKYTGIVTIPKHLLKNQKKSKAF
jgi:hypothetical protein